MKSGLRVFLFVFLGVSIATFLTGVSNRAVMSVEERIKEGEILGSLDAKSGKFLVSYSCGGLKNYLKYDIDRQVVLENVHYKDADDNAVVNFFDRNEKAVMSAGGLATLGYKYSDMVKISQLPAKVRNRYLTPILLALVPGYYLGELLADWSGLHCYSARNADWLTSQDWNKIVYEIYARKFKLTYDCVMALQRGVLVDRPYNIIKDEFLQKIEHEASLASLLQFGKTHRSAFTEEQPHKSEDFLLLSNALRECEASIEERGGKKFTIVRMHPQEEDFNVPLREIVKTISPSAKWEW